MRKFKKIAIIYDWMDKWGGVERVLLILQEIFPQSDFFTSYFDPEKAAWAKDLSIKTSFIQKLPPFLRRSRIASLPFYPFAFESFDFSEYELVISVTSSFAKSVITKPETFHLCYLLTSTRFLWTSADIYLKKRLIKAMLFPYLEKLRVWDFIAGQRPDKIVSVSQSVADRCRKFYKRDSEVIYPPFDKDHWNRVKSEVRSSKLETNSKLKYFSSKQKYFLVVSRLEPYKKVELAVQSFNRLDDVNLVVVGEGSEKNKLKKIAKDNIFFVSNITDAQLGYLYSQAQALVMPQDEDFGYVSLEAQFFGCPVIAYHQGGAVETVIDGKTGIFFDRQNQDALTVMIKKYDMIKYELKKTTKEYGVKNAEKFEKSIFKSLFLSALKKKN
ncbi:hypothetical protein A2774_01795 [Candidatus Roizmanbacteria bacterium RIFCSPHIGHO2_01_FULL_39_12c]|uniref:Glycosyl transferase family 1 domain-containing protein n=1 Tax=Candidatus Roizmanbacteria bacterium RIFCSPHIGHO2_01_FULL_39_12c TaxID=1802031 RepID=A0A1F7GB42_9BACT|nr:MAG: hypothetical protein A2774_01795 [Candidatus Roizmanbacteria bacterium RIFCSPHIGHO2_01_FULL_39_12c]OGK46925.1 MAG: hypothetical protein A2963_05205 [Candidatus Roizmanbacteria bacterium RIFCSPLOWO2_01_FULL_40_13]